MAKTCWDDGLSEKTFLVSYLSAMGIAFVCTFFAPLGIDDRHKSQWAVELSGLEKTGIAAIPSALMGLFALVFYFWTVREDGNEEEKKKLTVGVQDNKYGGTSAGENNSPAPAMEMAATTPTRNPPEGGIFGEVAIARLQQQSSANNRPSDPADRDFETGTSQFTREPLAIDEVQESGKVKVLDAGETRGDYSADWTETFDYYFLVSMIVLFGALCIATAVVEPKLWTCSHVTFWLVNSCCTGTQMAVGLVGGGLCRYFNKTDEAGYIMTNKNTYFKVNYTRKIQHLAAYVIPLVIVPPTGCSSRFLYPDEPSAYSLLQAWWAHWFTLLGFLLLIKPVRERLPFFMIQFNSMDRPEDRPNCLNWLVGGNIFPGYCLLIPIHYLFGLTCQAPLIYTVIFIVGIGDGLAEPVGVMLGLHKYETRGCCVEQKYKRSYEGSAVVFLSGIFFPCCQYSLFANPYQFIGCLLMPPCVMVAEATAPHTLDTISLIVVSSAIFLMLFWIFPEGHLSPDSHPACVRPA